MPSAALLQKLLQGMFGMGKYYSIAVFKKPILWGKLRLPFAAAAHHRPMPGRLYL
jgi:hypothetical protein